MLIPRFGNLLVYSILKYVLFCLLLMMIRKDFGFINGDINGVLVYFIFIIMPLCVISYVIFALPVYLMYKSKISWILSFIILLALGEYYVYSLLASELDAMNGVYLEIVGILLMMIFYGRSFVKKFK